MEGQFDNLHILAGINYKIHVAIKTFSFGFWLFILNAFIGVTFINKIT